MLLHVNEIIMSKIMYCISVWADVNKALKQKVQTVITEMYIHLFKYYMRNMKHFLWMAGYSSWM